MAGAASSGLTPEQDQEAIHLIQTLDGGPLSDGLFTALAQIMPQPVVEVCVLRDNAGTIETLLLPRPAHDPVWPGTVHTPGSVLRLADFHRLDNDPIRGALERVERKELGISFIARPQFVGIVHCTSHRGAEVSQVFLAEIPSDAKLHAELEWYPVDQLADRKDFIQHQVHHNQLAAAFFRRQRRGEMV